MLGLLPGLKSVGEYVEDNMSIPARLKRASKLELFGLFAFCIPLSVFAYYMRFSAIASNVLLEAALLAFCYRFSALESLSLKRLARSRRERFLALVALCFGSGMVLSYHIVYEEAQGRFYLTASECYFSPWSAFDIVAALTCAFVAFCVLHAVRNYLLEHYEASPKTTGIPLPKHPLLLGFLVLFICWTPWLVSYYPGLIFTDTLNEFLTNPFYTLPGGWLRLDSGLLHPFIIGAFDQLAQRVGNDSLTFLFVALFQMSVMALVLSHFVHWLAKHCRVGIRFFVWVGLLAYFGLDRYFAATAIAHWKDPLFAMAIIELVIALGDILFAPAHQNPKLSYARFTLAAIFAVLMRNNGQAVLGSTGAIMLVSALVLKHRSNISFSRIAQRCGVILVVVSLANYALMSIVLPNFGATWTPHERMGLRLAQISRVGVIGGELSEEDAAYLNSLYPLEQYADIYSPRSVDPFKWTIGSEAISILERGDFTQHWVSIGLKNPRAYFGAWVFQTSGFWSVNRRVENIISWNFEGGIIHTELDYVFLPLKNHPQLLEVLHKIFPLTGIPFPAGWTLWLTVGAMALLISLKRSKEAMILLPQAMVLVGLALFSVTSTWPRYALPGVYLLALVPVLLLNCDFGSQRESGSQGQAHLAAQ